MRHDLVRSLVLTLVVATSLTLITGCRRRPATVDAGPLSADGGPTGRLLSCSPGQRLLVGCDSTVGIPCMGDPTLSVCAGPLDPASCSSSSPMPPLLQYDDDGGDGLCPLAMVTCPASGLLAVQARPFGGSSSTWVCDFGIAVAP